MSLSHHLKVLPAALGIGIKQTWRTRYGMIGDYILYTMIIVLYAYVIRALPVEELILKGLLPDEMIWYMCLTEWVVFSSFVWGYKDLQEQYKTERIHLNLIRPYPLSLLYVGTWAGTTAMRFILMTPIFLVCAFSLTKGLLVPPAHLLWALLYVPLPFFIMSAFIYLVGTSTLWLVEAAPAFWIWQKLMFTLGAMLWPLTIYPHLVQKLAILTPFPAILAFSADWMIKDPEDLVVSHAVAFGLQVFWTLVLLAAILLCEKLALRHIQKSRGA